MAQDTVLEEVIVTAQKREQNLQEVPISVAVISGEVISNQNLVSLQDLAYNTPAVTVIQGGPSDRLSIRGVFSGNNVGFEQSVGMFVDGVYKGRSRYSRSLFMDVERVEILKGPQSTFFGNSAIAGALNITTRKPGDRFEGYVSALYEPNHGEYNAEAAFGGPISDTLGARIAIKKWGMDGYVKTLGTATNEDGPQGDDIYGRTTLVWAPSENFDASLKVELGKTDTGVSRPNQLFQCPPDPALFPSPGGFCSVALAAGDNVVLDKKRSLGPGGEGDVLKTRDYVLTLNYENRGHIFTSITGFSNMDFRSKLEIDVTSQKLFNVFVDENYDQFSQEFRVASPTGKQFEYLGGVYYQEGDLVSSQQFTFFFLTPVISRIPPFAPLVPYLPFAQETGFDQSDKTYSVFGSLTWNISDALRLAVGVRWMKVKKDATQRVSFGTGTRDYGGRVAFPPAVAPLGDVFGAMLARARVVPLSRSDSDLMPSVNVNYDVNDDVMVYSSYAQGFKAGGFDAQDTKGDPDGLPFAPEFVDAYEIGMKSLWLDGALKLNLALFRSEYQDLQESASQLQGDAIIFAVSNVASMTSQGIELETQWAITDRLNANLSFTYLDAKYNDFPDAGCTAAQAVATPPGTTCVQDLSGRSRPFSPDYSGNLRLQYVHPLPRNLRLLGELGVYFTDGYFLAGDLEPVLTQDSYTKFDARLSLGSADGRWVLSLIGKNLSDELILNWGSDQPTSPGSYVALIERPRNIAIQGQYRW
ncbi:MAG: TonB-dependent receptor [Gammaproteobacteria bacterium]|nr:TonB-dependent receptor [Gammaproteobacteria bacterium]